MRPPRLVELRGLDAPELPTRWGNELFRADWHPARLDVVHRWNRLATTHRSYLYEHHDQFPQIDLSALSVLEQVGKASINLALLTRIIQRDPSTSLNDRNQELGTLTRPVRLALIHLLDLPTVVLLGKGAKGEVERAGGFDSDHAKNLLVVNAHQVLGVLSVYRAHSVIDRLIDEAYTQVVRHSPEILVDYYSILSADFEKTGGEIEFSSTGPDHNASFTATARKPDGRVATGSGSSKREARRSAARAFLERYRSDLLPTPTKVRTQPLDPRMVPSTVLAFAGDLARSLGVEPHRDLFVRALIHSSWVFEKFRTNNTRSMNNASLAHLGSFVVTDMAARIQATNLLELTAKPNSYEAAIHSISAEDLVPIAETMGVARHILTGVGQSTHGVSQEMAVGCVQAVLAAGYLAHGNTSRLEASLPQSFEDRLRAIASKTRLDYLTQLQQDLVTLDLSLEATFTSTGKQHNSVYRCDLVVSSERLGETISSGGTGSSKRRAQQAAAEPLVRLLRSSSGPWQGVLPRADRLLAPHLVVASFFRPS